MSQTNDAVASESALSEAPPSIGPWRAFLTAVAFLTRIPVDRFTRQNQALALKRCIVYFPLVGLLIGLCTCGVLAAAAQLWPTVLAVLVALACEALLTGAFHEDALADFFDAFGGGWSREDVLRILKDSRIGTYGALALLLGVALRGSAMVLLVSAYAAHPHVWITAIAASAMVARWMSVLIMALLPRIADRDSLTRDIGARASWGVVLVSTLFVTPVAGAFAWLLPLQALLAVALMALAVGLLVVVIQRKLGGVTGDCLGCICYVTQVMMLLAAAWQR